MLNEIQHNCLNLKLQNNYFNNFFVSMEILTDSSELSQIDITCIHEVQVTYA